MSGGPSPVDPEAVERTRDVAQRAIRRLDLLEWMMFGVGAGLAMAGGALVAWMLAGAGWPFRPTFMGASLVLFVGGGVFAIIRIRKEERADALRRAGKRNGDHG